MKLNFVFCVCSVCLYNGIAAHAQQLVPYMLGVQDGSAARNLRALLATDAARVDVKLTVGQIRQLDEVDRGEKQEEEALQIRLKAISEGREEFAEGEVTSSVELEEAILFKKYESRLQILDDDQRLRVAQILLQERKQGFTSLEVYSDPVFQRLLGLGSADGRAMSDETAKAQKRYYKEYVELNRRYQQRLLAGVEKESVRQLIQSRVGEIWFAFDVAELFGSRSP